MERLVCRPSPGAAANYLIYDLSVGYIYATPDEAEAGHNGYTWLDEARAAAFVAAVEDSLPPVHLTIDQSFEGAVFFAIY